MRGGDQSQIIKPYELCHNSRLLVRLCMFSGKVVQRAKILKTKHKGYRTPRSHLNKNCILCECSQTLFLRVNSRASRGSVWSASNQEVDDI